MNEELLASAVLGRDAEEFLASELGRYLVGRAEQDAAEAMDQLKRVHPWRRRKIQELQNTIRRSDSVRAWLAGLVIDGRSAIAALEDD